METPLVTCCSTSVKHHWQWRDKRTRTISEYQPQVLPKDRRVTQNFRTFADRAQRDLMGESALVRVFSKKHVKKHPSWWHNPPFLASFTGLRIWVKEGWGQVPRWKGSKEHCAVSFHGKDGLLDLLGRERIFVNSRPPPMRPRHPRAPFHSL